MARELQSFVHRSEPYRGESNSLSLSFTSLLSSPILLSALSFSGLSLPLVSSISGLLFSGLSLVQRRLCYMASRRVQLINFHIFFYLIITYNGSRTKLRRSTCGSVVLGSFELNDLWCHLLLSGSYVVIASASTMLRSGASLWNIVGCPSCLLQVVVTVVLPTKVSS